MTGTKKNCNYFTNNLHFTLQSDSYAINTDQLTSLTLMKKSNSPNKNCTTGNLLLPCQYPIWMELLKVATLLFKTKWRSKDKLAFCVWWRGGGGGGASRLHHIWRWKKERSETSALKIQTPGNRQKGSTQHSEHGDSLKSSIIGSYLPITNQIPYHISVFLNIKYVMLRHVTFTFSCSFTHWTLTFLGRLQPALSMFNPYAVWLPKEVERFFCQ
jgi:hypothetical protein